MIFLFLFVFLTIGTILSFDAIFSYVIHSFLSVLFTPWLPLLIPAISKFFFDFSPLMILFRLIVLISCFFLFSYKNHPSNINILTIIIYSFIFVVNLGILILYILIDYFHILLFIFIVILIIKYFYLQIPNNFLYRLRDQINIFFCHSFNQ